MGHFPLSLDEAYLDVTGQPSATIIAKEIKRRIREATGLTASAGVSVNKFLAKIASDYNKPDGLFVITGREAEAFVEGLTIEQFWGVGKATAERMHWLAIRTGADLKRFPEAFLVSNFGKMGHMYYRFARAVDERPVEPERIRKSIGAENTYLHDIDDREELAVRLREVADEVWRRASKRDFYGRTVTLKIKYSDFEQITRSRTLAGFVTEFGLFWQAARELLDAVEPGDKRVRLMGLTISNACHIEQPEADAYQLEMVFE